MSQPSMEKKPQPVKAPDNGKPKKAYKLTSQDRSKLRIVVIVLIVITAFVCMLAYSADLLSAGKPLLRQVQDVRLTLKPYTSTPTVTPTKRASLTPTATITSTPTGTLPKPSKTPIVFTPTFTQTSTPTQPAIDFGTLRSESYYQWRERLMDTWLWRHLYALLIGVLLASWVVVLYVRDVYRIPRLVRSAGFLTRLILLMPLGTLQVKGGNLVDDGGRIVRKDWILTTPNGKIVRRNDRPVTAESIRRTLRLLRVGIPARLTVAKDSCVVIEGRQNQSAVHGPTEGEVVLSGFGRIRQTVYLGNEMIKINLRQPTNDGILMEVEDLQLVFSVFRDGQAVTGEHYPYVEEAIFNLVYRYWLEGEWRPAMTERITAELRQFITEHAAQAFLPYLTPADGLSPNLNQSNNPFYEFVMNFNEGALFRGIELHWSGKGKWKLACEVDLSAQYKQWQEKLEKFINLPETFACQPAGGEFNQELIELIRQVPVEIAEQEMPPNVENAYRAQRLIIQAYHDKLIEVWQLYVQNQQAPPAVLVEAIEHLNRLLMRRVGDA